MAAKKTKSARRCVLRRNLPKLKNSALSTSAHSTGSHTSESIDAPAVPTSVISLNISQ